MSDYWSEEIISEYIDGRLSKSECEQVEAYLKEHPQDAEVASELAQLRDEFRDMPRYRLDDNFSARVTRLIEKKNQVTSESVESPVVPAVVRNGKADCKTERSGRPGMSTGWKSAAAMIGTLAASLLIVLFVVPRPKAPVVEAALTANDSAEKNNVAEKKAADKPDGKTDEKAASTAPGAFSRSGEEESVSGSRSGDLQQNAGGLESPPQPSAISKKRKAGGEKSEQGKSEGEKSRRGATVKSGVASETASGTDPISVPPAADNEQSGDVEPAGKVVPENAVPDQPASAMPPRGLGGKQLESSSEMRAREPARRQDTKKSRVPVEDETSRKKRMFSTESSAVDEQSRSADSVDDTGAESLELAERIKQGAEGPGKAVFESANDSYRFAYDEVVVVRNQVSREKIAALQVAPLQAGSLLKQPVVDEADDSATGESEADEANEDKIMDGPEGEKGDQFQYATPPFRGNARGADNQAGRELARGEPQTRHSGSNTRRNRIADSEEYLVDDVAMFTVEATEEEFADLMAHLGGETISMDESELRLSMVESVDSEPVDTFSQQGMGGGGVGGGGGAGADAGESDVPSDDGPAEVAPSESIAPEGAVLRPMQGNRQSRDAGGARDPRQEDLRSAEKGRKGLDYDDNRKSAGREVTDRSDSADPRIKPGTRARARSGDRVPAADSLVLDADSNVQPQPLRRRYLLVIRLEPEAEAATEPQSESASDR